MTRDLVVGQTYTVEELGEMYGVDIPPDARIVVAARSIVDGGGPLFDYACAAFEDADYVDEQYVRDDCGDTAVVVSLDRDEGMCAKHLPIVKAMPLADLAKFLPLAWENVHDDGDHALRD